MSCCHGSVPQEVRPGTARVLVTELSGSGHINPTPATKPCENSGSVGEPFYLSPEKLVGFPKCLRIQSVLIPLMHPVLPYLCWIHVVRLCAYKARLKQTSII